MYFNMGFLTSEFSNEDLVCVFLLKTNPASPIKFRKIDDT